jgi:hypothetical protein
MKTTNENDIENLLDNEIDNEIDIENLLDNEIDLDNLSEDGIIKLLGACCLHGTNTEYINK